MDVVGSEIGQKMRSAIKAKLTELGCYVDDELPDYVMVMVANKRTRAQMEEDLQLFLGDNTELFVNWLHQVLKKLQEVTVPAPKEPEKVKEKKSKDKDKTKSGKKTDSVKKSKKKDKIKEKLRKKEEKKAHKSKKKSKHHDIIRPNVPPLLMNMEKDSEPSITDVFAGQILKNHGVIIDTPKEEKVEQKPVIKDVKRPILPIIDPATISQPEAEVVDISTEPHSIPQDGNEVPGAAPREEQIKEINEIEAKIQGLKQKLAEQLDSMSDDEDFLNIRTEAEELMNDFAEDVFQEISSQAQPVATPPVVPEKSPSPPPIPKNVESVDLEKNPPDNTSKSDPPKAQEPEVLPQIELKLPKRPVRERLGAREQKKIVEVEPRGKESSAIRERKRTESPERFTPDREPDFWGNHKSSAKSRLGEAPEPVRRSPVTVRRSPITVRRSPISIRKSPVKDTKKSSFSTDSESDAEKEGRRKERKRRDSSSSPERPRVSCASVVRVRPRPRVAPSSSLLMRAVADAHKSLLNIPPKVETEPSKIKRALVHPMRRGDPQNIVIHVPSEREDKKDIHRDEYIPVPLSKKFTNTDYVPCARRDRTASRRDDTLVIETINIHNTTVDKDKDTQFIVTMDGFDPNAFLAKKLKTEGILDDDDITLKPVAKLAKSVLKTADIAETKDEHSSDIKDKKIDEKENRQEANKLDKKDDKYRKVDKEKKQDKEQQDKENIEEIDGKKNESTPKKRLSDTSDDSDTQVIIKPVEKEESLEKADKRKSTEESKVEVEESPPVKKRKASPIVFNVARKEKDKEKEREKEREKEKEKESRKRQRTESAGSDGHVVVTTAAARQHKYDTLPPLSQAEKKPIWCRSFPLCRYGALCAFQHPRCKFAAACTRRGCPYTHGGAAPATPPPPPPLQQASAVVVTPNYKSISAPQPVPSVCKYYPSCVNPACHFYHPKPCRYGLACANKLECNFYHNDVPKWRYPV